MGRSFSFSSAWAQHARMNEQGSQVDTSGDDVQYQEAEVKDPKTGEVLTRRVRARAGTDAGFFDDEIRAGDNLLNHTGTERDYARGVLRDEYIERDQQGNILGTRVVEWEQLGDSPRTRVLARSRFTAKRYFFT